MKNNSLLSVLIRGKKDGKPTTGRDKPGLLSCKRALLVVFVHLHFQGIFDTLSRLHKRTTNPKMKQNFTRGIAPMRKWSGGPPDCLQLFFCADNLLLIDLFIFVLYFIYFLFIHIHRTKVPNNWNLRIPSKRENSAHEMSPSNVFSQGQHFNGQLMHVEFG